MKQNDEYILMKIFEGCNNGHACISHKCNRLDMDHKMINNLCVYCGITKQTIDNFNEFKNNDLQGLTHKGIKRTELLLD